jgi:hypothetical protein
MRHLLFVMALIALAIPASRGVADVPEFMNYQGVLREGSGVPVPDGTYALTFRLYDVQTGGLALWTEAQTTDVVDGMINVKLGKTIPLSGLEFDVPYWLGIAVGVEAELVPRIELATVPYAGRAAVANHCDEIEEGQVTFESMQNVFELADNTWYWSQTTGLLDIDHYGDNFPAVQIDNHTDANDGDCLYLESTGSMAGNTTYVLYSNTYKGRAGQFTKFTDDDNYSVQINGASGTSEGLYVYGTIVSTAPRIRSIETTIGREPVFGIESPDQEVIASGRARLTGGTADVAFETMFEESVARDGDVRVTVTPIGGWSALYVERTAPEGFSVRSADGDANLDFYWTAVGRSKDAVDRAEIVLPDPEEERRIEAAKMAVRG